MLLRIIIGCICVIVMVGCFIGLYGGKMTSDELRSTLNYFIFNVGRYSSSIQTLQQNAAKFNANSNSLSQIASEVDNMLTATRTAQTYITPMDATRLGLLFFCVSMGMLSAVTMGVGSMLKRKEAITTGFLTCIIAIFLAWASFAVNYAMAVTMDDGCYTLNAIIKAGGAPGGFSFGIGCLSGQPLNALINVTFALGINSTDALTVDEQNINAGPGGPFFNPITVDSAAVQAASPNITTGANVLESQYNATLAAVARAPCSLLCNTTQFNTDLDSLNISKSCANALVVLSDCGLVASFFDRVVNQSCSTTVKGILLIFVGNIIVGSLLIPVAIMGLYVHQKFPNRSSAAMTKTRIMVLFMYQFFLCLVCVLSEINTTFYELLISIGSLCAGIVGFFFLNIPMNKLDWPVWAQVLLACFLGLLELACLAGWIWLFYYAIQNNIACSQQLQTSIANLIPQISLGGICSQSQYLHTLIVSILGGVAMMTTLVAAFLAFVFSIKTICGTRLNLEDSDFELD